MTAVAHRPEHETDRLGMLVFLASETMLFGAIFAVALVLAIRDPAAVAAASARLDVTLGAINTALLLTSSLLVAIGVAAPARRTLARCFGGAAAIGVLFMAIKAYEWAKDWHDGLVPGTAAAHALPPGETLYVTLYLIATGLHGLHLTIGILLLGGLAFRARSRRLPPPSAASFENAGLYWHLVDTIWLLLFPVLYLMRA